MALGELVVKDTSNDRWLAVADATSLKIPPDAIEAKVVFSDLGRALFDHFRKMGEFTSGLKQVVEFSTPEYERRRDALFAAARVGAVLISPCISDGERQIAREALAAGYRLVTMHNKGFSKFQKPSGRYFDACAEGRLLMLVPVAWPYQPNEKPMTRADATAMNRLCQWLAGDGAATIDYHGMTPADIDRLALAAVTRAAAGADRLFLCGH